MQDSYYELSAQQQFGQKWILFDQEPIEGEVGFCKHLAVDNRSCSLLGIECILRSTIIEIELYEQCPVVQTEE